MCGRFAMAGNPSLPNDWLPYMAVFVLVLGGIFAVSYVQLGRSRR
jgi:hypothetical protein